MTQPDSRKQDRTRKTWTTVSVVAIAIALFVSLVVVKPAVPDRITLLTGPEGGAYHALGLEYAEDLRRHGLDVDVEATAGLRENMERVARGGNVVAFSPSILEHESHEGVDVSRFVSLGSVEFDPLWLFYRADTDMARIDGLAGRTIHTGAPGTVSDILSRKLIEKNGLSGTVKLRSMTGMTPESVADGFAAGAMDAVFVTGDPGTPVVAAMLSLDGLRLFSFERAEAYAQVLPGVTRFVIPEGALDLARNHPSQDTEMLSAVTCLVAHEDLHSAVVPMLLGAAGRVAEQSGGFTAAAHFPSGEHVPFPLDVAARRYFNDGETGLAKILPYQAVRFLNHLGFMVVPLLAIILVLVKSVPMGLRLWLGLRMKGWFAKLAAIEKSRATGGDREQLLVDLDRIDTASAKMFVPRASAQDYVDFRQFLSDLRERVQG